MLARGGRFSGLARRAHRAVPDPVRRVACRAGRRGLALLILAATWSAYGTGLILGYRPTFTHALHVDAFVFGWAWIGAAAVTVTGVLVRRDRWHFAFAVAVMAAWALLLATNWTAPYGWAAAVSWMSPCALALLISSWPEQRW